MGSARRRRPRGQPGRSTRVADTRAQSITDRLTSTERDRSSPNVRPKDAATLIIIDREGPGPKVLMGRRHAGHKFMPGKFVFPGGRIEKADVEMAAATELDAAAEAKLALRPRDAEVPPPRAFPLAAIRETYEETGLQIGRASCRER